MKINPNQIIDIAQDNTYVKPESPVYKPERVTYRMPTYHWQQDRPDSRDYPYAMTQDENPSIVDLRPWCTPVEHQGSLGSCTGQAIAGAIELLNNRDGRYRDISRLFIYYWERFLIGTVNWDSGAFLRDGIKATNKWGASLESLWPHIISRFRMRPSNVAMADAIRRRVTRYERIADGNLEGCFDALAHGFPITIGFGVYSSFESAQTRRTGVMTYPNVRRERYLGGHAVLLVGYDKTRNVFIARNSWGANWGDRGYFYMPFQVVADVRMSRDLWVIKGVQNP